MKPKTTRNCCQFGVCGTNLGADAVAKPTGSRRRRNTCKRKWRRYRNPLSLNQATRVTHGRTDTSGSFSFI
ncbi:hypothetical protein L596_016337 [Steinernema carpocapsae]|uniref:Uncharacterized protein n=1 Tax=Steinernema carpocapsae TaxID=34508 RepID=A0A4U5NIG9_STECR|nr:hypothetical protein L596_016337 [Steinernema carpocapsae]